MKCIEGSKIGQLAKCTNLAPVFQVQTNYKYFLEFTWEGLQIEHTILNIIVLHWSPF